LTDQSIAPEDKDRRRLILDAAVRVFARKGFHTCRVGEIAEEAGVSHGLLYHYFPSKDAVLETVFRETWVGLEDAIAGVEASGLEAREQLRQVAAIFLRSWRRDPDLVRVLVREIGRSPELYRRLDDMRATFGAIERIIIAGQERGELRTDIDPLFASAVFYGGIDQILTGWVLGLLSDGDEGVSRAERTIVDVVCAGLAAAAVAPA
jgi:TetR/AcrR family fatty acid metabolism transcriptional regulator